MTEKKYPHKIKISPFMKEQLLSLVKSTKTAP